MSCRPNEVGGSRLSCPDHEEASPKSKAGYRLVYVWLDMRLVGNGFNLERPGEPHCNYPLCAVPWRSGPSRPLGHVGITMNIEKETK